MTSLGRNRFDFKGVFVQYQTPPVDVCIQSSTALKAALTAESGPDKAHPAKLQQMKRMIKSNLIQVPL